MDFFLQVYKVNQRCHCTSFLFKNFFHFSLFSYLIGKSFKVQITFILIHEVKNNDYLFSALTSLSLCLPLSNFEQCMSHTHSLSVDFLMEKTSTFSCFMFFGRLQLTNLICSFIYLLHYFFTSLTKVCNK